MRNADAMRRGARHGGEGSSQVFCAAMWGLWLAFVLLAPAARAGEAARSGVGPPSSAGVVVSSATPDVPGASPEMREVIPGTRWRLESPGRWTADERRAFERLAARLPGDYRLPRRWVTFRKRPAPDLSPPEPDPEPTDGPKSRHRPRPDRPPARELDHPLAQDLLHRFTTRGDRHLLGRAHRLRSRVTLYVDGLEARLAPSLSRAAALLERPLPPDASATLLITLLERQIVHELTHLLDARAGWSKSEAWRRIGGWSLFARALRTPPTGTPRRTPAPTA